MANAETRLVRHNLLHPGQPRRAAFTVVPSAVFAGPQVASVGATEQELQAKGLPYVAASRSYGDAAYGWALEDTSSFVKVLADPGTRLLLGAHIIGPQASALIQPLIQAMCLGNTVDQVASGVLYIHPALTEVVEQALLELLRRRPAPPAPDLEGGSPGQEAPAVDDQEHAPTVDPPSASPRHRQTTRPRKEDTPSANCRPGTRTTVSSIYRDRPEAANLPDSHTRDDAMPRHAPECQRQT